MKKRIKSLLFVCLLCVLVSVFCIQPFALTKEEYAEEIPFWNSLNQFNASAVCVDENWINEDRPYVEYSADYYYPYGVVRIVVPAGFSGVCWVSSGAPLKELCPYMVAGRAYSLSVLCNGTPATINGVMFHNGSEDGWWGYNRSNVRIITEEELNSLIYFYPCLKVDTAFDVDTVFELTICINESYEPSPYSSFAVTERMTYQFGEGYDNAIAEAFNEGHKEGYEKGKKIGLAESPKGQGDLVSGMLEGLWTNVRGAWDIVTTMQLPFTSLTIGGIISIFVVGAIVAWLSKLYRGVK